MHLCLASVLYISGDWQVLRCSDERDDRIASMLKSTLALGLGLHTSVELLT